MSPSPQPRPPASASPVTPHGSWHRTGEDGTGVEPSSKAPHTADVPPRSFRTQEIRSNFAISIARFQTARGSQYTPGAQRSPPSERGGTAKPCPGCSCQIVCKSVPPYMHPTTHGHGSERFGSARHAGDDSPPPPPQRIKDNACPVPGNQPPQEVRAELRLVVRGDRGRRRGSRSDCTLPVNKALL